MGGKLTGRRARYSFAAVTVAAPFTFASIAYASDAPPPLVNGADVAWLLTSSALVLMMTIPGLALFYGGLVRRKNVLSTVIQSFILAGVISIEWVLCGYSLAFAPGNAIIGGLAWLGLSGVSASEPFAGYSPTVPHQAYMIYQCMFAIITPALISGAVAERMSFRGFLMFTTLWSILIYNPLAHWV
jgi:Amt family ammonium transporter